MNVASIPSPTTSVWHLGSVPIRAYAICIILGILLACYVMERRMRARGAPPYTVLDVAIWAVPFGIIGARIYHVITSWQGYFGAEGHPLDAFKVWEGGLGVWGSVAGGALGAWLAGRQMGLPLSFLADTLAPGLALAQGVGRWGNWFNNELFGRPTNLPWGVEIHKMESGNPGQAVMENGHPVVLGTFQPTFLYESIWDIGVAVLVWLVDRRFKLGRGRAFALYVMAYTAGRGWIEAMRTDPANHILGLRLNIWTSVIVFIGALIYFVRIRGPQQFVVPASAEGGDGERPRDGYRVVTEAEYRRYRATGDLPWSATEKPDPDGPDPDGPDPGRTGSEEPDPDSEGSGEPDPQRPDPQRPDSPGSTAKEPAAKEPAAKEPAASADDR